MWIAMLLLLALAVFIVWDSRRLHSRKPEPLSRKAMARGYVPKGLVPWHGFLTVAVMMGWMAAAEWNQPSLPPYTGRWSLVSHWAFAVFGERGVFVLLVFPTACLLLAALIDWRSARRTGRRQGA